MYYIKIVFLNKEKREENMRVTDVIRPGMSALSVVEALYKFYEILLMEFIIYPCEEKPHFDEAKVKNPKAKRSVSKALQHTPDFQQPTIFVQGPSDFEIVRQRFADLKEINPETLEITSYLPDNDGPLQIRVHEAMKVVSRVRTKNGIYHIPLLDLDIPIDENGAESAREVFLGLGIQNGAIINSGMSYHGWGLELLSDFEWHRFMAKALLLDRIDRRWVGHRLLDGQANLRVSEKWGNIPTVVHVF